jgi:hypothetical protein
MSDFLSELLDIEWFRITLLSVVAGSALLLLLTIPMYFVVWPVLRRLRLELAAFHSRLALRFADSDARRAKRLDGRAADYLHDGALERIVDAGGRNGGGLGAASRALRRLRRPVRKAAGALTSLDRRVADVRERLQASSVGGVQTLPALPSADTLIASHAMYRRAWLTLGVSVVMLLIIVTVNTGLSSTILPAIGFVSPGVIVAGIPLATIIAFLMAATETGIGVCHAGTRDPEKLPVWPAFFILLAFPIALFEGWAFSQMASATATFRIPVVAIVMPQSDLFFLFGFVITWTLFGLGALVYESASAILGGRGGDLLSGALRRLRKTHDAYAQAARDARNALSAAAQLIADVDRTLHGPGAENVAEKLDEIKRVIDSARASGPGAGGARNDSLTPTEVWQLAYYAGLWLIGAALGTAVIAIVGWNMLAASLHPVFKGGLAIGQALVCFGVGSLLSAGESVVVRGTSDERPVVAGPMLSRIAAIVIGSGLMLTYVTLAYNGGFAWILAALVGLFLMAAGHQLTPLLGVLPLSLARWWQGIAVVAGAIALLLVRVVIGVVFVLEFVAAFFAEPLRRLFSGRDGGTGSARPPAVIGA